MPRVTAWYMAPMKPFRERRATPSQRREAALEIGHQILRVLQPHRKPQEAVADAHLGAGFGRKALVSGRGRMRKQAFRVAEVVGNADEPQRVGEAEGALLSARHYEGDE